MRGRVTALLLCSLTAGCAGAVRIGPPPAPPSRGPVATSSAGGGDVVARGIALYEAERYAEAEATLRQDASPEAQSYLAATLVRQDRLGEAELVAQAALAADPPHPVAVAALGEALVRQNKHAQAIRAMTDALARRADLAYAYYWRGQALYRTGKPDRMVSDLQTFLRLAPNAPEAPSVRQLLESLATR